MMKRILTACAVVAISSTAALAQDPGFAESLAGTVDTADILKGMGAVATLALGITVAMLAIRKVRAVLAGA